MSTVPFDTLQFAEELKSGGFTPEQATSATKAVARAMAISDIATKTDVDNASVSLKAHIDSVRTELKGDINRLDQRVDSLEQRMESGFALVRRDMDIMRRDITLRLGGLMIASVGILLTGMRVMI